MPKHRIFATPFASVYPLYVQKAERKNRTKEEIDQIICWLTGYSQAGLQRQIEQENDFETFFAQAPAIHPKSSLIKGVVCGVRVEEIEDPLMQNIRYFCYRTENPFAICGAAGGFKGRRKLTGTRNPSRSAYCIARSPI